MKYTTLKALLLAAMLSGSAFAQPAGGTPAGADDTPIYGSQLMTEQERLSYRQQMRSAASVAEQERLRIEHHEQMQIRAKERGVTLPEMPPVPGHMGPGGGGMGPGGGGMGPGGGGMGPGGGGMGPGGGGMGPGGGMGGGPGR